MDMDASKFWLPNVGCIESLISFSVEGSSTTGTFSFLQENKKKKTPNRKQICLFMSYFYQIYNIE